MAPGSFVRSTADRAVFRIRFRLVPKNAGGDTCLVSPVTSEVTSTACPDSRACGGQ
jgi:hypothetical protein